MKSISNSVFNKTSKWEHYNYPFKKDMFITDNVINKSLQGFWNNKVVNLDKGVHINIIFKVYINNFDGFKSISLKYRTNVKEYNKALEYCIESWNLKSIEYKSSLCSEISYAYRILPNEFKFEASNYPKIKGADSKVGPMFGGYSLPNNIDYTKWGKIVSVTKYEMDVRRNNSTISYNILFREEHCDIRVYVKGSMLLTFKDYKINLPNSNTSFKRIINNQEYIYNNGVVVYKSIVKKTKFIKKVSKSTSITDNFLTMDLETRVVNGIHKPYCVSLYDGKNKWSYFVTDYKNSDIMLEESVLSIMTRKYNNYRVYLHNFSNFDSIFLINTLHKLTSHTLKPNRRDGKLINVDFKYDNYTLYFRDSYLLLPLSLKKLAISFNVDKKGIFPHKFLENSKIELNYIGNVPELKYFYKFDLCNSPYSQWLSSVEELKECITYRKMFADNKWNLRKESIKYCEQDVITLYQIINEFNKIIFKLYRINIHKYPTLPSLAFSIYRSNYMNDAKIPIITGKMYDFFYTGYTGGSVDVYKPKGVNIYRYDVNSLYPYVMRNCEVPIGNPTYFEGNVLDFIDKPYGIFEVKVTTPKDIKIPLLQRRFTINGNRSTIAPVGSWTGVYHSEELNNASKYGYKFQIIRGFLFNKSYIFTDYVDSLYNLKENSVKGTATYVIAKMLLNSLYGRLGMSPKIEKHEIVNNKRALEIENCDSYIITDITPLDNGKTWISYISDRKYDDDLENSVNISVAIALSITAMARVHMSQFKTMYDRTIYYMDTDSVDIDKKLDDNYIGPKLGQMKLEHEFKEAVFLAPKVYGGVCVKGKGSDKEIYEIVRAKGYKDQLSYNNVKSLLLKDSVLTLNQEKWYKDYTNSQICTSNEIYRLMVTTNKRELIYDSNNLLIDTKPLEINE